MKVAVESQTNHEDESFWHMHYESHKSSGDSRANYCRQHQINYDRFGYWIHKWKHQNKLISVKLKSTKEISTHPILLCELDLKNGYCLKIYDEKALNFILERAV